MHRMTFIVSSWLTLTEVQDQLVLDYFHLHVHFTQTLARKVGKVLPFTEHTLGATSGFQVGRECDRLWGILSNCVTDPMIIDMPTWSLWCSHCVTSLTPIEQDCESWLGLQSFQGLITSIAHCCCKLTCVHSIGPADSHMLYTIGVHMRHTPSFIDWDHLCDGCSVLCVIRNRNWETPVQ